MKKILTWFPEDKAAIINHFLSEVSLWFSIYYCPDNLERVHLTLLDEWSGMENKIIKTNKIIMNHELQK